MSNRHLRRNLRLLASTSAVALALTAAPVSVRVLPDAPAWHIEAPSSHGSAVSGAILDERAEFAVVENGMVGDAEAARRKALARLGLAEGASYVPPVMITLSQARAASGGGSGGGGSGGGGGGGGGSGGAGASGGDSGAEGASGASSGESSVSGASGSAGATGGSFGDVEQVGPSLSQDEEALAISAGWQ